MSAKTKTRVARKQRNFWTRERLIIAFTIVLFVAILGLLNYQPKEKVATNQSSSPQLTVKTAAPGPPAPALTALPKQILGVELKAAKGASFKLEDFSGKVLLINLWASWCGPCRSETPALVQLHKEFRPRGVEIVGLSTEDPATSTESVHKFINQFGVDYTVGWAGPEVAAALMQGRDSIPQSFIVARDGRILKHFIGFGRINTPDTIKQALEEALNDKS